MNEEDAKDLAEQLRAAKLMMDAGMVLGTLLAIAARNGSAEQEIDAGAFGRLRITVERMDSIQ